MKSKSRIFDLTISFILSPIFLLIWCAIGIYTKIKTIGFKKSKFTDATLYMMADNEGLYNLHSHKISKQRITGLEDKRINYIIHLSDKKEKIIKDGNIIRISVYIPKIIWNIKLQFVQWLIIFPLLRIKLFLILYKLKPKRVISMRSIYSGITIASLKNCIGFKFYFSNIDSFFWWLFQKETESENRNYIIKMALAYLLDGYVFRRADLIGSISVGMSDYQILLGAPLHRISFTSLASCGFLAAV